MRYLYIILLGILPLALFGQHRIRFETGDHIYILEDRDDIPMHYIVDRENELEKLNILCGILTEKGTPECEIWYDPESAGNLTIRRGRGDTMYVQAIPDIVNPDVLAFNHDTATQPIFYRGEVMFPEGRFLEIRTPHLTRATSFRIHTPNRVFVIVKGQPETAEEL